MNNISEVYIGPFFVGVLTLVALALPIYPELACHLGCLEPLGGTALTALGVPALGLAYVLGVVLDRLMDTMLASTEQHHRLKFAVSEMTTGPYASQTDPFPEDHLRVSVIVNMGEAANTLIDGLRTRIRLMRTAIFIFPVIALASAFAALRTSKQIGGDVDLLRFYEYLSVTIILVALVTHACRRIFKLPRTDESEKLLAYAKKRQWIDDKGSVSKPLAIWHGDIAASPLSIYLLSLSICAAAIWAIAVGCKSLEAADRASQAYWPFFLLGLVLSLLAFCAWWRTSETFMKCLVDLDREYRRSKGKAV